MNVPERHRALAHEFVDGVKIERLYFGYLTGNEEWLDDYNPAWNESFEYRRKPKAKVKKWLWTYKDSYGRFRVTGGRLSEDETSGYSNSECLQKIDASMREED